MVLEAGEQLGGVECRGPEFSHDYSAAVIGDLGSLDRRGAGAQGQSVKRDGGVARSRHIEDFARAQRIVVESPIPSDLARVLKQLEKVRPKRGHS